MPTPAYSLSIDAAAVTIDASFRMGPAGADHSVPTRCQQIRDGGTDGSAVADQQDLHQSLPWLCESLAGYRG